MNKFLVSANMTLIDTECCEKTIRVETEVCCETEEDAEYEAWFYKPKGHENYDVAEVKITSIVQISKEIQDQMDRSENERMMRSLGLHTAPTLFFFHALNRIGCWPPPGSFQ